MVNVLLDVVLASCNTVVIARTPDLEGSLMNVASLTSVIGIDLALAADNAIVIAAVAASLPAHLRRPALVWGTAVAIALRILATSGIVAVLALPGVALIGGLVLLFVAVGLMRDGDDDAAHAVTSNTVPGAVMRIALADLALSIDNALAVAGAAHGSYGAVAVGLIASVLLLMFGGSLLVRLMERLPGANIAAGAIVAVVGIHLML